MRWSLGAAGAITGAFEDVHRWSDRPGDTRSLREAFAVVAYMGLGMSYLIVPVTIVVSPLAAVGHTMGGATVSWHTSPSFPNLYVEGGFGGLVFGHPASRAPAVGCGPIVGAGTQVGKKTVGVRLLVSPPGLNVAGDGATDTVLSGAFVFGL